MNIIVSLTQALPLLTSSRNRLSAEALWRLHLGIYCFRRPTLEAFVKLPPSPLERAEGLEQLRALENGMTIRVLTTDREPVGVDTPEDLEAVRRVWRAQN